MSAFSDLDLFCKSNELDARQSKTLDAYRRNQLGLPWEEGTSSDGCVECGKHCVKVSAGRWHCFYCGAGGKLEGDVAQLTPEQQRLEKQLLKEQREERKDRALRIWDQCGPIGDNDTVATYLAARQLELPPDHDAVMRWHPACPFGPKEFKPCIVSLFRCASTDEPMAIHRTWISSASAGKCVRKALGPIVGSAIKLWPLTKDSKSLTVGEGIETVLAAVKLGVGLAPAWAATVANNLSSLPVINDIARLTIVADNDPHGKGVEHAKRLRRLWLYKGREVVAVKPEKVGWDFNDVLVRGR